MIIGGGPMGSSTAYHLASASGGNSSDATTHHPTIWVLERDPTYRSASATVSASGIRQQFSIRENVQMSAFGRDFLRDIPNILHVHNSSKESPPPPDVQFQEHGYLFLASTPSQVQALQENHVIQRDADPQMDIHLLTPDELKKEFPWLHTEDVALGSFGKSGEGWFDPWAFLMALKHKNIQDLGVTYKHAEPLQARRMEGSGAITAVLVHDKTTGDSEWIRVGQVVNAAGPYAQDLLDTLSGSTPLQSPFPVRPRKRNMFYFKCRQDQAEDGIVVPHNAPLTVEPTLENDPCVYFRSEGPNFVCGVSPPPHQDVDCIDPLQELDYVDHHWWENVIWPTLYHRVPAFGNIKLASSWCGLYEYNTVDQNAIIDFHPEIPNLMLINGFSGHGLQHAPAAGRGAAELLVYGAFTSLDLRIFSYDRLLGLEQKKNNALIELGIV